MKKLNYRHSLKTINNKLVSFNTYCFYKWTQAGNDIYVILKKDGKKETYYSKTDLVEAVNKIINK